MIIENQKDLRHRSQSLCRLYRNNNSELLNEVKKSLHNQLKEKKRMKYFGFVQIDGWQLNLFFK